MVRCVMVKVLLVDDEKLALEYLENIINWEYYGFEIVGITTDAEQALKLFRKNRPHLVISDVRMPTMSGLELVTMIREIDKRVHILFLSGYKNFGYVKQAIRLGIDDYLLKSDVDEESFLQKILGLKEEIQKECAKNQYTTNMILESLFLKNEPEEHYKNILDENEYIRIHKKYYYVILAKNLVPGFIQSRLPSSAEHDHAYDYEFGEICAAYASEYDLKPVSAFAVDDKVNLGIFELTGNIISQKEINDRMYQFSNRVIDEFLKKTSLSFCIYYYAKGCPVRQFGRFYEKNKKQLWRRYVTGKPQVAEFSSDLKGGNEGAAAPSVSAEQIYQVIKNGDKEGQRHYMERLKTAIRQEDIVTYLWYAKVMFDAVSRFEGSLLGEKSGRRFSLTESSASYDFRNPDEAAAFLEFKMGEIELISGEVGRGTYSDVIQEALNCLQEHYMDADMSTNMVAQKVNLSNSWLSTKFKEEVGIGLSDYLNSIRIQKAKQLLDQSDYMIYEVAEMTGFTSSQYFSKIFKQFTGLTPNEYKRKG